MSNNKKYTISIGLNVLNHLGINLYSSIPAVLSEVVANAWDADASLVDIKISVEDNTICITDDGHGMSVDDLNKKYLHVGYQRREKGEFLSPEKNRPVMGRKGIGKLSLFSIANRIEVHSVKGGKKSGLVLNRSDIQKVIKDDDQNAEHKYYPVEVSSSEIDIEAGTKIIIKGLRKNIKNIEAHLRTNLARKFSIIGLKHDFMVKIDGVEISSEDRNYFSKIQYLWLLGEDKNNYKDLAKNAEQIKNIDETITVDSVEYKFSGWIGTLKKAGDARDKGGESLNNISIIVRGKSAQNDILNELGDAGIYAKYIVGEIHANFLDDNKEEDIATSSRQNLIEDDPRYQALKGYLKVALSKIRSNWTKYRNEQGATEAKKNPKISEWMKGLDPDTKTAAEHIFGKINQMSITEDVRNDLFAQSVLLVEHFHHKRSLAKLDNLKTITPESIKLFSTIFSQIDEIEAMFYYKVTEGRMKVIKAFEDKVNENLKEKIIQEYLYNHLWLLDPAWERSIGSETMEQTISKEFEKIDVDLSDEEKKGRIDIKYKTYADTHIIIELKRPSVTTYCNKLIAQVDKYRRALKEYLKKNGIENQAIETICIVGEMPKDYDDEYRSELTLKSIKVITYNNLFRQTHNNYALYIEASCKAGRLVKLIDSLTPDIIPDKTSDTTSKKTSKN